MHPNTPPNTPIHAQHAAPNEHRRSGLVEPHRCAHCCLGTIYSLVGSGQYIRPTRPGPHNPPPPPTPGPPCVLYAWVAAQLQQHRDGVQVAPQRSDVEPSLAHLYVRAASVQPRGWVGGCASNGISTMMITWLVAARWLPPTAWARAGDGGHRWVGGGQHYMVPQGLLCMYCCQAQLAWEVRDERRAAPVHAKPSRTRVASSNILLLSHPGTAPSTCRQGEPDRGCDAAPVPPP